MSANQPFAVMRAATAIRCVASSLHQHQMGTDTERGQSLALGTCRLALVADYQPQDRSSLLPARAGFLSVSAHLPVGLGRGFGPGSFHRCADANRLRDLSANFAGANRLCVRNPSAHQKFVAALTDVPHLSIALSKSGSSAGSNNASKRLQGRGKFTQALGRFIQGSAPND